MKKITITLILLLVATSGAMAQNENDNVANEVTKKKKPLFSSIAVGIDLLGPGMRYFGDQGDYQATLQAGIRGMFLPVVELGYGTSDKKDDLLATAYKSKGTFGRIGCDYNVLKDKLDDYRLTVGIRYGISHFDYDTTLPTDSLHKEFTTTSESCTLHWLELAFGVDVKVWGPMHMGWSVRYRRRLKVSDYINDPRYAPGFGNATESSAFMALYSIGLQF